MCRERGVYASIEVAYRRHHDDIYRYLLRRTRNAHDAQELAHDVFVDALRAVGDGRAPESIKSWLYATAQRRAIDQSRRDAPVARVTAEAVDFSDARHQARLSRVLLECLADLPASQRDIAILRLWRGYSTDETAAATGTTPGACKMRLGRARRELRRRLAEAGEAPSG